jgi:chromosome segregation ATPase
VPDELIGLDGLPGRVQAELTRLRAERQVFTAEQDRLKAKLAETEHELRAATADVTKFETVEVRDTELEKQHAVTVARVEALEAEVLVSHRQRDSLRAELKTCREERDKLRLALLDAELVVSAGGVDVELPGIEGASDRQRLLNAERRAAEMARELDATRRTVSWRVTAPLRVVRKKMDRP